MGVALTCMSAAPVAAIFITGSTESGCVRFIIAYLQRGDTEKARGMVQFNRLTTVCIALLLMVVLFAWQLWSISTERELSLVFLLTAITAALLGWLRLGAAHAMAWLGY